MDGFKKNLAPALMGAVVCFVMVMQLTGLLAYFGLWFYGTEAGRLIEPLMLRLVGWLEGPALAAGLTVALWVLYLAVMHLAKLLPLLDTMPAHVRWLAWFVAGMGLALDLLVNWLVFTFVCLELPRSPAELVTGRLQRYMRIEPSGLLGRWRRAIARWMEPLLDPFDPSGDHI